MGAMLYIKSHNQGAKQRIYLDNIYDAHNLANVFFNCRHNLFFSQEPLGRPLTAA